MTGENIQWGWIEIQYILKNFSDFADELFRKQVLFLNCPPIKLIDDGHKIPEVDKNPCRNSA